MQTMNMSNDSAEPPARVPSRPLRPGLEAAEFPVYAALKMQLHDRIRRGHHGMPAISARSVQATLERAGRSATGMAELHGVTSHYLRERLRNLNHGTVLIEVGPGLRDALTYLWKEPTNGGTINSYAELHSLLGDKVFLALDVARIAQTFGTTRISVETFIDYFQWLRRRMVGRPWSRLTKESATGPEFVRFMAHRLRTLVKDGFVQMHGGSIRLSPKGEAAAYWFDLFMNSVDYGPAANKP